VTPAERRSRFLAELRRRLKLNAVELDRGVATVLGTLAELQEAVRQRLARQDASEFDAEHLPAILRELDGAVDGWARKAAGAAADVIEGLWLRGPRLVEGPLGAAGLHLGRVILPRSLLDELQHYSASKITGLKPAVVQRIEGHVRLMVLGGQTPHQAMVATGSELGTGPFKFVGFRAETQIRTEGGRVYSMAGQRRLVAAAGQVPGLGKKWLRGKNRPNHAIAGQKRGPEEKFRLLNGVELMYPRELGAPVEEVANCACQSVPHKDDW
jgi:hypothetical protein